MVKRPLFADSPKTPAYIITVHKISRTGKTTLSYRAFLSNLLRVTPCERKEWKSLGVDLTGDSEERIEDVPGTVEFIEAGVGGSC